MIDSIISLGKAYISNDLGIDYSKVEDLEFNSIVNYIANPPYNLNYYRDEFGDDHVKYPHILIIDFVSHPQDVVFSRISFEKYQSSLTPRIIAFPARGGSYSTPTLKLSPEGKKNDSVEKKIELGIIKALNHIDKYLNKFKEKREVYPLLSQINSTFTEQFEKIKQEAVKKQLELFHEDNVSTGINTILTIRIDNLFPGEHKEIISSFQDKLLSDYKFQEEEKLKMCSLCHKKTREISGHFSPFSFYTPDKKGYIAGGFEKTQIYFNFPVCKKCAMFGLIGKTYIESELNFKLGNVKFYLIPRVIISEEMMTHFIVEFGKLKSRLMTDKAAYNRFTQGEETLLYYLSDYNDSLVFNFLFYETSGPGNSVFSILTLIQDVAPSRIKRINIIMNEVEKYFRENRFPISSSNKYPMAFTFRSLSDLFYNKKSSYFDRDGYLAILWILFCGNQIKFERLITLFFRKLKGDLYLNNSSTMNLSIMMKSFLPILFLFLNLNQLSIKSDKKLQK